MVKHIWNFDTSDWDLSDEGDQTNRLESQIEAHYALQRLPSDQQQIVRLTLAGYNQMEIAEKLGCGYRTIKRKMALLRKRFVILN